MYAANAPKTPTQHDGKPSDPDDDVSTPPDPAIGSVLSVQSNRTRSGWKKMTQSELSPRVALGAIVLIVGGIFGVIGLQALTRAIAMEGLPQLMLYETPLLVVGGIVGAVVPTAFVVVAALLTRKRRVSYIGTDGVMDWSSGLFGSSSRVLRFSDAHELRVRRVRQFVNGAYTGTSYDYQWTARTGSGLFRLHGSYVDTQPIVAHDPVAFAFAAERAWTRFKVALVDRALKSEGVARFPSGRNSLGVGRGFLELNVGGKIERLDRSDIESIHAQAGALIVKRRGAREGFFSSEGVFKFPIAEMADFTVFAITLEEQVGLRIA